MIVPMARVRIIGPREQLPPTVRVLQDFGLLQIAPIRDRSGLDAFELEPGAVRRRRYLRRLIGDAQAALEALGVRQPARRSAGIDDSNIATLARWARLARRIRRKAAELQSADVGLAEERALIQRYRDLLDALAPDLRELAKSPHVTTHAAIIPGSERPVIQKLVERIESTSGNDVVIKVHPLPSGDLAILIVIPKRAAARIDQLFAEVRVPELTLPAQYHAASLSDAVPKMLERLARIPAEQAALERTRRGLAAAHSDDLLAARSGAHDVLARLDAMEACATTRHAFALEGWTPKTEVVRLTTTVKRDAGPLITIEEIAAEEWTEEPAPVVLRNPRLFRPFEPIVRFMPLPRYGTIDPTPFVAVFFPLLFGLMLADVGYGLLLGALGLWLHRRSKPGSAARQVAEMMGPCALLATVSGLMFGELFGDLGRRWLGLHPLLFERQEAIVASLLLAIGLGAVHVVLGLVLGVVSSWRHERRRALGRGVAVLMVGLITVAILASVKVLPGSLLTPSVIALLVAFPALITLEGIFGAVELLSTVGNILSYARVMALGTASVMLAVVANRLAGAVGSTIVGVLFALLFHLVNFGIGVFGPSVHALRLHYVEFFGKFYSPGGIPYRPLAHWRSPVPGYADPGSN